MPKPCWRPHPTILAGIYTAGSVPVGFTDIALSTYAAWIVPAQKLGSTLNICSTLAHAVAVPMAAVALV